MVTIVVIKNFFFDFQKMENYIVDTVFYDSELECEWLKSIDFLSKVRIVGIIQEVPTLPGVS